MIKCLVKKDDYIKCIDVSGHANFSEYGSDIVCSAVSMLCYAIGNKIILIDPEFSLTINENNFTFVNEGKNKDINLLHETLVEGLLMVEDQYGKYIEIKEV